MEPAGAGTGDDVQAGSEKVGALPCDIGIWKGWFEIQELAARVCTTPLRGAGRRR